MTKRLLSSKIGASLINDPVISNTIELRDGSVLAGDLVSINGMQVEVRSGGNTQTFDRNQVKRILLTERVPVSN